MSERSKIKSLEGYKIVRIENDERPEYINIFLMKPAGKIRTTITVKRDSIFDFAGNWFDIVEE